MLPISSDLNKHILYNSGKSFLRNYHGGSQTAKIISIYKLKIRREITIQEAQNTATDKARESVLIGLTILFITVSLQEKKANFGHNNT